MIILPKLRIKNWEWVGVELFASPPELQENEFTFLSADSASGSSSFTVDNGLKFGVWEYVVVGNIGDEKAEIIRIHTTTAPTATTITLASSTSFAHNRGEKITFIPYNKVVIESSSDDVTYSTLTTLDIRVDSTETYYNHTAGTSATYYKIHFYNSSTTGESSDSDAVLGSGFVDWTVGQLIREVLVSTGEQVDDVLTKEFLYEALNDGRDEIDRDINIERWSFRTAFDYDAWNVIPWTYRLAVPTDLRDPATWKNILSIRIGKDKRPLDQKDKRAINSWYEWVAHTTLNGAVADTDTSIVLTSSGDFDESGSISVSAVSVATTIDSIDYTANAEATNTLSGVTGIQTGGHTTGMDVWQSASFGLPTEYTVDNSYVIFSQPFSDDYAGENIWLDYYKKITKINSDADTFDEPFYEIYKPYLRYRIKLRKNPEIQREADDDYKSWIEKRESQVRKEFIGQDKFINIDIP